MKGKEDKQTYRLSDNMLFMLKKSWEIDKLLFFVTLLQIPIVVLLPLMATYLSKYVVELVTNNESPLILVQYVVAISTGVLVLRLVNNYFDSKIEWRSYKNRLTYFNMCLFKIMDMDYQCYENPNSQMKLEKAFDALSNTQAGAQQIFRQFVSIVSNVIGLITYSLLIFYLNPYIVLLLVGFTVVNYLIKKSNNKWVHKNKDNWVPIDRKLGYIKNKSSDFKAAKDMRLYDMSKWFKEMFNNLLKDRLCWHKRGEKRNFVIDIVSAIMMFIRDGIAYVFLIHEIYYNGMSAADFIFYFAIIAKYSEWLLGMINAYSDIELTSLNISNVREFLDIKDIFNRGKGKSIPKHSPEIVFKNVSFRYPKCEEDTIKDINIRIKQGEKIALVGTNGAGKTTLVKLLSGLYRPTCGEILINGSNISQYNRDEYYKMLSVVFQDILVMPVSIEENISQQFSGDIDKEYLNSILYLAGLQDKVQGLTNKEKTRLLKSVYDDAIDLSGGEVQKLALARALYKAGKIIILDEPTAALDPIAENGMYLKYNELTLDATSIFISHRLSSTRFCDRILFLEDGKIVEEGSHESLMKLGSKYANMFNIQSHYYKEGECS